MITSGWVEPHTDHDKMAGNEPGHGVHFGTSIIAVHKRAKKLFGLFVMDESHCTPFKFDSIPKEELVDFPAPIPYSSSTDSQNSHRLKRFEEFIIQEKRERERQKGWDMYYEDIGHRDNQRRR